MRGRTGRPGVVRSLVLGVSLLVAASACEQDLTPTKPVDGVASVQAEQVHANDSTPFYYFHHKKIYLDVDPTRLVVGAQNRDQVQRALASEGVIADSITPTTGVPNY